MSYITQGVAAITRNAGKIARAVKGIKNSGPAITKGLKSSGVYIGKGLKNTGAAISSGASAVSTGASAAATSASKAAAVARDTIGAGVTKVKNLFGRKPAGVVKEVVLSKGGPTPKPLLRTRVREIGRFDETLTTGLKNIQDIPKTGVPKQVLTKSERLGAAKQQFRSSVVKQQKGMAYI